MTDTTTTPAVWFITGAARGMGIELAQAALDAGRNVVGTARDAAKVTDALGEHDNLLAVSLDITDPAAAQGPTSSVPTLTKMGEVTSDLAAFENLPDNVEMRIERQ